MAVPAWALTATGIVEVDADENFSAFGGGAAGLNKPETQFYIKDSECWSKDAWSSGLKGMMHDEGADMDPGTDGAAIVWVIYHVPNALTDSATAGQTGMVVRAGADDDTNYWYFEVGDGNTLLFETWVPWAFSWDQTNGRVTVGTPTGNIDHIGAGVDVTSGPSKGSPFAIGLIRVGRHRIDYTAGETADYSDFAKAEAYANAGTRRWGLIEERGGSYQMQGFHRLGTATTAVDFRDSDRQIFIRDTPFVPVAFNKFEVLNASSNVDWTNILITSLGTQSPCDLTVTSGAFDAVDCQFTGMGAFTFLDANSATGCIFTSCDTITAPGTDLSGSSVLTPTVSAGTAAVVWNVNQDPDGELDDMAFSKGTAAHHAIEFGANTPSAVTLRDIDFSGFNASNGQNDSVIYNNTGGALTVNVIGGSGTVSYRNGTSATTNVVINPVSLAIHVQDIGTQADISGAQCFVQITETGHGWPYQATLTSITRSGTTATVTHPTHGLSTNDYVLIEGATDGLYEGCFQITVTGASTYTYTMNGTPAANAVGDPTLLSTFAVIMDTTDVNGDTSASYSYSSNQPISGRVRYTGYKTGVISGSIDSTNGRSITLNLVPD